MTTTMRRPTKPRRAPEPEPKVFHRWVCSKCESIHYEHERSREQFARFVAKHKSRCGRPQEPTMILAEHVEHEITTREHEITTREQPTMVIA